MRLQVSRYSIEIIPDSHEDEAYLEEVLGLKQFGDDPPATCEAKRVNAIGLSAWAYLQLKKKP